jgi:hypothetical protein
MGLPHPTTKRRVAQHSLTPANLLFPLIGGQQKRVPPFLALDGAAAQILIIRIRR